MTRTIEEAAQQALEAWDQPHGINYVDFRPYMDALRAALAEPVRNEWKEAVVNELITAHIYSDKHDTDPRKAVQDAISWNVQVALDPLVSSDAQELIDRGAAAALTEEEPVAWRTFDGEGGYDYRDYENNEDYIYQYVKRNGGKYAHWVEPLYTTPPPRYNRSPHDLTEFVNYLCEISNKFAGTTQLNDRITTQVLWYLKHTDPLPPKF